MRLHPFYGTIVLSDYEQEIIQEILSKYRHEIVNNDLKKKVYNELMEAKKKGLLTIPFKVVLRKDPFGHHRPHIEVILDTKV